MHLNKHGRHSTANMTIQGQRSSMSLHLTLCLLGNFACFLSSAHFFFKINLFFKKIRNYIIKVSKRLDPDQARRHVGPDLGPSCLQRLSADDASRQIPKGIKTAIMCPRPTCIQASILYGSYSGDDCKLHIFNP